MKKNKKENKKKILIPIIAILVLLIVLLILWLTSNKGLLPYVEEKKIEVLSAKEQYSVTAEPYFKDGNGNVIDVDGITVKISNVSYRFYDYSVSEPDEDEYVTHSFKIEATTPIEYIEKTGIKYPTHKYTYLFSQPSIFDYYTGYICREKHVSKNNTVNYYDLDEIKEDMAYTEMTWKEDTYKIGVRVESSAKRDGIKKENNNDGTNTVRDTHRSTIEIYIYAPKDFDGLMLFFSKKGTTKQDFLNQLNYNKKYNELVKEYEKTGEKTDELVKMENRNAKVFKLLDSKTEEGKEVDKDTFYVMRVSDIEKKSEE